MTLLEHCVNGGRVMPYNYSQKTMDRLLDYGDELQGRLPRSFVKKYSERAEPPVSDLLYRHGEHAGS